MIKFPCLYVEMDSAFHDREGPAVSSEQMQVFAPAAVISLMVIFLTWVVWRSVAQRSRLPPGPRGLPILGSMFSMGHNPNQSLFELSKKYGPLMFMQLGRVPAIVVSNAAMAKEVLKTHDQVMSSRPDLITSSFLTYGQLDISFAPYGPHWRQLRKLCNMELFTPARIKYFEDVRGREVLAMLQSVSKESEQGNAMNARLFLENLTMNIITLMLWRKKYRGVHEGSLAEDEQGAKFSLMLRDFITLLPATNMADFIPVLKPLVMKFNGLNQRMKVCRNRMEVFFTEIVEEHREAQSRNGTKETSDNGESEDDFVDVMVKLAKDPAYAKILSIETMIGFLMDLLAAGTDTAFITMEWALAELLRQPDVMRKVQDELMSVVGADRLMTEEDIPSLKYLGAVINETLRLHPPAPMGLPRLSTEDCTIAGFHVAAKTLVFPNLYAIQRDPAAWERTLEFVPERFLNSDIDFKGTHYEFIPFSSGRRMCPGINVASIILNLALGNLLHSFNWTFAGDEKPEDMDMSEFFGLSCMRAIPLSVLAKPRLADHVIRPSC